MKQTTNETQAQNAQADFTKIIAGLEHAVDMLNQISGLFTLLHFMGEGDGRVDVERKFDRLTGTLRDVGDIGEALVSQAFSDVVDAEREMKDIQRALQKLHEARPVNLERMVVLPTASRKGKKRAARVNQKIAALKNPLPDELKEIIAAFNRYEAKAAANEG